MVKNKLKVAVTTICFLTTVVLGGCGQSETLSMENNVKIVNSGSKYKNATVIELETNTAKVDGKQVEEFDYTWNCDPGTVHDEIEDAPAEYFTGKKPDTEAAVYIDHELYYYPLLDESGFTMINYDGEKEWAYYYTDGENDDYIFATLPVLGQSLPTNMMHSAKEAAENKVLHITKAGTYVLKGAFKGQIKVDLGEDAYDNAMEKVTLILDGADVECSVAPGIIFENVYECDENWEDEERTDATVDTKLAGANIVLADGSENYILGTNVFRMLKNKYKDADSRDEIKLQKKMRKVDGALYSYMSMNIDGGKKGNGVLTVDAGFEGVDSELHLTVNGGNITINSQDDGMNVNEDHKSVISFLGGDVTINAALGAEGDGVDSNGYIGVDGATLRVNGIRMPDSELDSEDGVYYTSGDIYLDGEKQSYTSGDIFKETKRNGFESEMKPENFDDKNLDEHNFPEGMQRPQKPLMNSQAKENFDIQEFKEKVNELDDNATYEDVLKLLGIDF